MSTADDYFAISKLLAKYSIYLDTRRSDMVSTEVFSEDAELYYKAEPMIGKAAIDAFFSNASPFVEAAAHVINNILIDLDGDTAKSCCYYQAWHWLHETSKLGPARSVDFITMGIYKDEHVRTSAGWRIRKRRLLSLPPASLAFGVGPAALGAEMWANRTTARQYMSEPGATLP